MPFINRRQFLKSAAVSSGALALTASHFPLHAASEIAAGHVAPCRFVFIRKSNGLRPLEVALPTFTEQQKARDTNKETLEVDLSKHELPEWLRGLDGHKSNMAILHGLSCMMSENGHYSYSSVMGCYKSNRNSLSSIKRATIDFELAKLFPSPFGHVELSLTGNYTTFRSGIVSGYSAPGPQQRNYCYADPETAFNELFKSVVDSKGVDSESKMLKFLQDEEAQRAKSLVGIEKRKLTGQIEAFEGIRERNKLVGAKRAMIEKYMPSLDKVHVDGGGQASIIEKQKAMTDILIASLITGLTNVVTYTIDELSTPVVGLPGNETDHISIHELGHNGAYSGVPADKIREKIRISHVNQIAAIIARLKAVPEGNGTMFDSTVILYFPENGETHHSLGTEAPCVVLAGKGCRLNMMGRYIRLPYHGSEGHKTLGNWYTTLLNAYGNPIEHYGDLDQEMSRKKLAQTGAIRQLLV